MATPNAGHQSANPVADPAERFQQFLKEFKAQADLTKKDTQGFENTTIDDVKAAIAVIEQQQLAKKCQRYMGRLKPFLGSLEQYSKVIGVFLNTSEILAFVWVS